MEERVQPQHQVSTQLVVVARSDESDDSHCFELLLLQM